MSFRPNLPARPADEDVAEVRSGDDGTLVLPAAPPGVDVVSPCPPESSTRAFPICCRLVSTKEKILADVRSRGLVSND